MNDRIQPVAPLRPVSPQRPGAQERRFFAGEVLTASVEARGAGDEVALSVDGRRLTLTLPPSASWQPGTTVRLQVLAVAPRLELAWLDAPPDAPDAGGDAPAARAWRADEASLPRLTPARPEAAALARDWREALLGRLAAGAARFVHEAGSHLPGALLAASPQLALAASRGEGLAEPPLPLWLPMWLWGGPRLALSVEDALRAPDEADAVDTLDLVLEATLPGFGRLKLRARKLRDGGVALALSADAAACRLLRERSAELGAAVAAAGVSLARLYIDEDEAMAGLAIGRHGASLFEARRVSGELCAAAAAVLLALCPAAA
ncbi:hypothetical protein EV683_101118 [Crenobacter luteus]|uniref:hypothetical protein n=1 Tax=Crenobacter luteus TaxID=1452487 RepID=UPI001053E458|nr:hypothetical protein [Crenobacter luteus]TCP15590.1 hypothetical protein EV683_101118 [Crenobacter luteus]